VSYAFAVDILAFCSVEPICFLAKREIGAWPLISTFARLQETVSSIASGAARSQAPTRDGGKNAFGPPHAAFSGGHDRRRRGASQIS
jgi:hypothetical protein